MLEAIIMIKLTEEQSQWEKLSANKVLIRGALPIFFPKNLQSQPHEQNQTGVDQISFSKSTQ